MKYLLYRSLGELEENEELHQLVGVEVGKDIYSVADTFVKIVNYDMNCEFPRCQGTVCYAPHSGMIIICLPMLISLMIPSPSIMASLNCKKMKGNTSGRTGMVSNGYKKS